MEGMIQNGSEISYKPETEIEFSDKNILYRAIAKGRWRAVHQIMVNQPEVKQDKKAQQLAG